MKQHNDKDFDQVEIQTKKKKFLVTAKILDDFIEGIYASGDYIPETNEISEESNCERDI